MCKFSLSSGEGAVQPPGRQIKANIRLQVSVALSKGNDIDSETTQSFPPVLLISRGIFNLCCYSYVILGFNYLRQHVNFI